MFEAKHRHKGYSCHREYSHQYFFQGFFVFESGVCIEHTDGQTGKTHNVSY